MKKEKLEFCRRVVTGTAVCFSLMVLGYLAVFSWVLEGGGAFPLSVFTRYTLLKFVFLFLFSLSVGLLNRVFEMKKPRPILRLIHFFGVLAAFLVFILLLMNQMNPVDSDTVAAGLQSTPLSPRYMVISVVIFVALYFVSVGLCALGRRMLTGKKDGEFQSIFK